MRSSGSRVDWKIFFVIFNAPTRHRGLPGPKGPEPPKGVRKESERAPRPGEPQSPQRVRHGVQKESKNAASDSFWTLFGLRGALFGDSGALPGRHTLSDSFRTLFGVPGPKVLGDLCAWSGRSKPDLLSKEFFCLKAGLEWKLLLKRNW